MNQSNTGLLIRTLRTEGHMTQRQLADKLGVTVQAVSKWERGQGYPDLSLLSELSKTLGISPDTLLSGELKHKKPDGGSMRNLVFLLCPQCGTLLTATGGATVSCCGRSLSPLSPLKPDSAHQLKMETAEDEWFLTAQHPMTKEHHISFTALVSGEQVTLIRHWPEWDFQMRISKRNHGLLYWYCTRHGLFRSII